MGIGEQIECLQEEENELRRITDKIEEALELAAKSDFSGHLKSLLELRTLDPGFARIFEHCHMGRSTIESLLDPSVQSDDRAQIESEHQEIIKALRSFREELSFATSDRTMAMLVPGTDLIHQLRNHLAHEEALLAHTGELAGVPVGAGTH